MANYEIEDLKLAELEHKGFVIALDVDEAAAKARTIWGSNVYVIDQFLQKIKTFAIYTGIGEFAMFVNAETKKEAAGIAIEKTGEKNIIVDEFDIGFKSWSVFAVPGTAAERLPVPPTVAPLPHEETAPETAAEKIAPTAPRPAPEAPAAGFGALPAAPEALAGVPVLDKASPPRGSLGGVQVFVSKNVVANGERFQVKGLASLGQVPFLWAIDVDGGLFNTVRTEGREFNDMISLSGKSGQEFDVRVWAQSSQGVIGPSNTTKVKIA